MFEFQIAVSVRKGRQGSELRLVSCVRNGNISGWLHEDKIHLFHQPRPEVVTECTLAEGNLTILVGSIINQR